MGPPVPAGLEKKLQKSHVQFTQLHELNDGGQGAQETHPLVARADRRERSWQIVPRQESILLGAGKTQV